MRLWGRMPAAPVANLVRKEELRLAKTPHEGHVEPVALSAVSPALSEAASEAAPQRDGLNGVGQLWARCCAAEAAREKMEAELRAEREKWRTERSALLSRLRDAGGVSQPDKPVTPERRSVDAEEELKEPEPRARAESMACARGHLGTPEGTSSSSSSGPRRPEALDCPESFAVGSRKPLSTSRSDEMMGAIRAACAEAAAVEKLCDTHRATAAATEESLRHLQDRLSAMANLASADDCRAFEAAPALASAQGSGVGVASPIGLLSAVGSSARVLSPPWTSSSPGLLSPTLWTQRCLPSARTAPAPRLMSAAWSARPTEQPASRGRRRRLADQLYELPDFVNERASQLRKLREAQLAGARLGLQSHSRRG